MENIKVSDKVSTSHLIPINVGTLAIIIIVVVTSCTLLTLLFLYCWRRMSSDSNLSCARCHQIIAVQGPEKPRQLVQQYFVVQPQAPAQQQQLQQTFGQQPGQSGPATASLAGLPGSRQQQQREDHRAKERPLSHQYENVPEIVIDQPQPHLVNCGDSATFQRLGMRERRQSQVSEEARALETRALSLVQSSPPDQASPGLEPLTPSPVNSVVGGNYLGQVKMVNFPAHQTPCVRTPANALRRRRSALKVAGQTSSERTVTVVQPEVNQRSAHPGGQYAVLEVSQMQGSDLTTGDLRDLVDSLQDQEDGSSPILGRNLSNSTNDTKTITPGSVCSPNMVDTPHIERMVAQYKEQDRRKQQEAAGVRSRETQQSRPSYISYGQELSPAWLSQQQQGKVNVRGSVSSPNIVITGHDQFVTDRKTLERENSQDPSFDDRNSVFRFDSRFNPGQPHLFGNPRNYQVSKSTTPSKVSETFMIDKTPGNDGKMIGEKTPSSSGKKSTSKIPRPLPPRSEVKTNYEQVIEKPDQDKGGESFKLQDSLKLLPHHGQRQTRSATKF